MGQLIVAVYKDTVKGGETLANLQNRSEAGQRNLIENACLVKYTKDGDKSISQSQAQAAEKNDTKGGDWLENLAGQIAFKNVSINLKSAGEDTPGSSKPSKDPSKVEPAPGSAAEKRNLEEERGEAAEYETDLISAYGVDKKVVNQIREAAQGEFSAVFLYLDRVESNDLVNRLKQNDAQVFQTSIISGQQRGRKAA